eukprot:8377619-Pyramimonas_sp.AAC.1
MPVMVVDGDGDDDGEWGVMVMVMMMLGRKQRGAEERGEEEILRGGCAEKTGTPLRMWGERGAPTRASP